MISKRGNLFPCSSQHVFSWECNEMIAWCPQYAGCCSDSVLCYSLRDSTAIALVQMLLVFFLATLSLLCNCRNLIFLFLVLKPKKLVGWIVNLKGRKRTPFLWTVSRNQSITFGGFTLCNPMQDGKKLLDWVTCTVVLFFFFNETGLSTSEISLVYFGTSLLDFHLCFSKVINH